MMNRMRTLCRPEHLTRTVVIGALISFGLLLASCASTQQVTGRFNPDTGETVYESGRLTMGSRDASAGLVTSQRVHVGGQGDMRRRELHPGRGHVDLFEQHGKGPQPGLLETTN